MNLVVNFFANVNRYEDENSNLDKFKHLTWSRYDRVIFKDVNSFNDYVKKTICLNQAQQRELTMIAGPLGMESNNVCTLICAICPYLFVLFDKDFLLI